MRTMRLTLAATLAVVALAAVGCGGGEEGTGEDTGITTTETTTTETTTPTGATIRGSVGPGFEISVATEDGQTLETLAPGSHTLAVEDMSSIHNFHLTGPGDVDVSTDVGAEGTESFEVELQAGTYSFVCDPHASSMNGTFEVGP